MTFLRDDYDIEITEANRKCANCKLIIKHNTKCVSTLIHDPPFGYRKFNFCKKCFQKMITKEFIDSYKKINKILLNLYK